MSSNKKGVTSRLVIPFLFVAHKNEGRSYLQEMSGVAGKFLVSHKKNVSVPNRNLCSAVLNLCSAVLNLCSAVLNLRSAVLNIEIHQEKKQLSLRAETITIKGRKRSGNFCHQEHAAA